MLLSLKTPTTVLYRRSQILTAPAHAAAIPTVVLYCNGYSTVLLWWGFLYGKDIWYTLYTVLYITLH